MRYGILCEMLRDKEGDEAKLRLHHLSFETLQEAEAERNMLRRQNLPFTTKLVLLTPFNGADDINDMGAFVEYTREAYAHGAFGDADADEAREHAGSIQRGAKRLIDAWDAGCVRIEAPAR